ncbi:MAG: hypothetical protein AUI47_06010 [Acidobacteria bacterium 13_1_40CM_2_68_5]|nr:MAG: hypothetical protein AUI47_06010 [Acidobacteria bacterium 13_1_40CM_2_68_5]
MRLSAVIALVGSLARISPAPAQTSCVPFVPCTDNKGCPDMIVDGTQIPIDLSLGKETWTSSECAVIEGEVAAGDRWLLRFDSATPNLGPGALIIGNPLEHPEWFDLVTCHGHPHFKEYTDYRLWTTKGYEAWTALRQANPTACPRDLLAANPSLGRQLVTGRKQGFCVVDVYQYTDGVCAASKNHPTKYSSCDDMGLSVCQTDFYPAFLDGQWIDVTGLQAGDYVLEIEVNAERFFQETDYLNNSASIRVTLPKGLH